MPLDPSIQAEIDAYLASKIVKVRIPELLPYSTYGDISLLDKIPLWMAGVNKTVWVDSLTYKTLLITGGSGTITPVITGGNLIHEVTEAEAGGDTVLIPELAGKTFFLRLEGRPLKLGTEFQILSAGGWKIIIPGFELIQGQLFDAEVFELQATPSGAPAALSSSFVVGIVEVTANTTLNGVNHANNLIQLRGGATKVTLTLPDIGSTPENAIFIIEATINNDYQTKVQTQGGQFIYMNNTSRGSIYVGKGESVLIFKGADGWYVLGDFGNYYKNLGKPYAAYSHEDDENELLCDGSDLPKEDYPRLWEKVQTLAGSLLSVESDWNNNKGCWLDVDTNTFRLPDLRDAFLRGVKNELGSDPDRTLNVPGGFQDESVNISTGVKGVKVTGNNTIASSVDSTNPSGEEFDLTHVFAISPKQGTSTKPWNYGIMWVIKY